VTRTLPLEIYQQGTRDVDAAIALSLLLVVVAIVVIIVGRPRSLEGLR
jgi:molybdate transport system permease protein